MLRREEGIDSAYFSFFVPTPESQTFRKCLKGMAGTTRLELATSAVTGQRSNQLNYVPAPLLSTSYSALWIALNRLVSLVVSVAHSSQPRINENEFTWNHASNAIT